MKNYFDGRIAKSYAAKWPELFTPDAIEPVVAFLAELAGGGPVLELGIGTGRIALPLSERDIRVHGIDLSPEMVNEMRSKPGADKIAITIGDFATTRVPGSFSLAYLLRNTIANLTSQDAQVECFRNVAAHLEPGGLFVIELFVPELRRLPPGQNRLVSTSTPTHLGFDEYDFLTQVLHSRHYWLDNGLAETFSAPFRYAWPAELDLMARMAGMTLRERWEGWSRRPFTSESRSHVSVWVKMGSEHWSP